MYSSGKRMFVLIIIGILLLKIILIWTYYFQMSINLDNPLIPASLLDGKRNYSFFLTGIYAIAIILGFTYLVFKKFFWAIAVLILIALIVPIFTWQYLNDYFLSV